MSDCEVKSQIHKYSSYKMLTLFEVLRIEMPKNNVDNSTKVDDDTDDLSEDYVSRRHTYKKNAEEKGFCTIVFVDRRFTAKIVFMVLKVRTVFCGFET